MPIIKDQMLMMEEWVVVEYLYKQKNPQKTKNIELLVALMFCKFMEKQWNEKCCIGLELEEKYIKYIDFKNDLNIDKLSEIINEKVKENTPIDFSIGKLKKNKKNNHDGVNYQLKRFGKNLNQNTNRDLIDYINKQKNSYGKTKANLIIFVEIPGINFQLVKEKINTKDYPFQKIICSGISENKYIHYFGIWPESGWCRFNLNTFEFDF